ncbi:class F sortase [Cellulomonas bogoriensis]|uniref:Peptidase C60 n=1 Tax=Cellulomonas bogoriensis 69B4 = DSM 16987 TaxID=1386082 RepID=A0A0A0BQR9_9CELL|nr:class F sortase [Cellulomonas bogoriensis]KGM09454.1 peptidase C60 [Cellulomonas bogoriensis 69B4 = DSM 16987]
MSPVTRPPHRAHLARGTALVAAALLVLTGCTAAEEPAAEPSVTEPAPTTAAPEPEATREVPDVPVRRADLGSVERREVVPPATVAVPALDIALPVDPVGVEDDGQMEIPPHAERAGWYRYGAAPGQGAGTSVIAAHVDSIVSAGVGPFARLRDLDPGDVVTVELEDGTDLRYVVQDVVTIAKPEITWDDVFVRDGGERLVLVTCGGRFRQEARSYTDNVIVTAVPQDAATDDGDESDLDGA